MRLLSSFCGSHLLFSAFASVMLLAVWPVSAREQKPLPNCAVASPGEQCNPSASAAVPDPVPNWALSKIRYQRWGNTVSFTGLPAMPGFPGGDALPNIPGLANMPSMNREVTYCMDRDLAAVCGMDCKVTVLSRTGLTQRSRVDCPEFRGTVEFVWAPDGLSWQMGHQLEPNPDMPAGMGMLVRSRYLGPCTELEARRDQ
jgi:hypothetical protein